MPSLFQHFPPPAFYDIVQWDWISQIYQMLREKNQAFGSPDWPELSPSFGDFGGSIYPAFSLVDNHNGTATITQSSVAWQISPGSECTGTKFNQSCPDDECFIPETYVAVLVGNTNGAAWPNDPHQVVYCPITANDSYTLTIQSLPIHNAITAGFIDGIGDLTELHIIQATGALWWDKRWLDKPNDYESWRGTLEDGEVNGSEGFLVQFISDYNPDPYDDAMNPLVAWVVNQWVGYDCMVYDGNGVLHRLLVTGNDSNVLFFGGASHSGSSSSGSGSTSPVSLTGTYILLGSNGSGSIGPSRKGDPQRLGGLPFMWYGGAVSDCTSIIPYSLNNLGGTLLGAYGQCWDVYSESDGCVEASFTAEDTDVWVSDQFCMCQQFQTCLSPNLYKTIRGLQKGEDGLIGSFIDHTRLGSGYIYNWYPATIYYAAGVNAWTASCGFIDGTTASVGKPPFPDVIYPIQVMYAILYNDIADGHDISNTGNGTLNADGTLTASFSSTDDGQQIYLSLGRSRRRPLELQYLYPRTCWIADTDDTDDTGGLIDPPELTYNDDGTLDSCNGAGIWIKRGVSGAFKDFNGFGRVGNSIPFSQFTAFDGSGSGTATARYVGDDSNDPFSGTGVICDDVGCPGDSPAINQSYYSRFWRGKYDRLTENTRTSSMKGVITEGGTYFLRNDDANWWNVTNTTGVLRYESGVSTGGSSTTLVDLTKIASDMEDSQCFWASDRFIGFDNPYEGFILEITGSSSGSSSGSGAYNTRVPIISADNSTGTITFEDVGIHVTSGMSWQIREPMYCLNLWEGYTVEITRDDGSTFRLLVEQSDDTSLYFSPQLQPLEAGWTYQLLEIPFGSLVTTATGSGSGSGTSLTVNGWTEITGSAGRGVPDIISDYGDYIKGDYAGSHLYEELYSIGVLLQAFAWSISWHNWNDLAMTPQINYNGRTTGVFDDQDFATSAGQWAALAPVAQVYSSCAENPQDCPEIHHYYLDGSYLDDTAPYAGASSYTGMGCIDCVTFTCDDPCDQSTEIDGSWIFAYGVAQDVPSILTSSCTFWAYSPAWPDSTGDYSDCETFTPFDIPGESLWTGGSAGLAYQKWAQVGSSGDSSATTRFSNKVGAEPTVVNWTITGASATDFVFYVDTGYTISNQVAIIYPDFQWT